MQNLFTGRVIRKPRTQRDLGTKLVIRHFQNEK